MLSLALEKILTVLWMRDIPSGTSASRALLRMFEFVKNRFTALEDRSARKEIVSTMRFLCKVCLGVSGDRGESRYSTRVNMDIASNVMAWFREFFKRDASFEESERVKTAQFFFSLRIHRKNFMLGIVNDKSAYERIIWSKSVQVAVPFYERDREIFEECGFGIKYPLEAGSSKYEKFDWNRNVTSLLFRDVISEEQEAHQIPQVNNNHSYHHRQSSFAEMETTVNCGYTPDTECDKTPDAPSFGGSSSNPQTQPQPVLHSNRTSVVDCPPLLDDITAG